MKGQSNRQKTISEQMRPTRLRRLAPRDVVRTKTRSSPTPKPRSK